MSSTHHIQEILDQAVEQKVFPGISIAISRQGDTQTFVSGYHTYKKNTLVTSDTIYDAASVTKSIPTALLASIALSENKLELDTPVAEILRLHQTPIHLKGAQKQSITLRHLLSYTAIWQLPKGLSYFAQNGGVKRILEIIESAPLKAAPGEEYMYTNIPAILVGFLLEAVLGKRLDQLANDKIFHIANATSTGFNTQQLTDVSQSLIAPSELSPSGMPITGLVHDESARTFNSDGMGAVGHAGLFSTSPDLLKIIEHFIFTHPLEETILQSFETNQVAAIGRSAGLGWELNNPNTTGSVKGCQLVSKTGFTGCIVVYCRKHKIVLSMLTNMQYPLRQPNRSAINQVRKKLVATVFKNS